MLLEDFESFVFEMDTIDDFTIFSESELDLLETIIGLGIGEYILDESVNLNEAGFLKDLGALGSKHFVQPFKADVNKGKEAVKSAGRSVLGKIKSAKDWAVNRLDNPYDTAKKILSSPVTVPVGIAKGVIKVNKALPKGGIDNWDDVRTFYKNLKGTPAPVRKQKIEPTIGEKPVQKKVPAPRKFTKKELGLGKRDISKANAKLNKDTFLGKPPAPPMTKKTLIKKAAKAPVPKKSLPKAPRQLDIFKDIPKAPKVPKASTPKKSLPRVKMTGRTTATGKPIVRPV